MNKRPIQLLVVAVFAAGLVLGLGACKGKTLGQRLGEKSVENMIEKATGGQAKVDLKEGTIKVKTAEGETEIGSSRTWPNDFPIEVPKPATGKVEGVVRSNQGDKKYWNITIKEAEAGTFDKYQDALKAQGWQIKMATTTPDGGILNAQKDKLAVVATWAEKGTTINITVTNQLD